MFASMSLPLLLLLFGIGAAISWWSGVRLSIATDILSTHYRLGQEVSGQILLAVVVNLPEIAIVAAASLSGSIELATGNLLGGIAIQTLVLVLLDAVAVHDRPLSFAGAALPLVLQGSFLIGMLALTVMGIAAPGPVLLRMTPIGLLLVASWVFGVWIMNEASKKGLPWMHHGVPHDLVEKRREDISKREQRQRTSESRKPISWTWTIFLVAAAVTLAGGVLLALTSERLAEIAHVGGALWGATILAAVTALPEVSSGIAAIKLGDYELAFSDIFGSNAFLPACLPLITLLSGQDPLANAGAVNLYVCALGMLLTVIYIGGLVFRPQKQYLRLGPDSWSVLVIGVLGLAALVFVH